jgi:hypothetical protein
MGFDSRAQRKDDSPEHPHCTCIKMDHRIFALKNGVPVRRKMPMKHFYFGEIGHFYFGLTNCVIHQLKCPVFNCKSQAQDLNFFVQ